MDSKTNIFNNIVAVIAICLFSMFFFLFGIVSENVVLADTEWVVLNDAKCLNPNGDNEAVDYDLENLEYARGIELYYDINANKYKIEVYASNSLELLQEEIGECDGGAFVYQVKISGEITIFCYAVDDSDEKLGQGWETKVKSDNLLPQEPIINEMDEWVNPTDKYTVTVRLEADNGNSELSHTNIYIDYGDDNIEEISVDGLADGSVFVIENKCDITVEIFDKAGNIYVKSYEFNKFDSIPPTAPIITVTPNKNEYAREFKVHLENGTDNESGVSLNGLQYEINGEFMGSYDGEFLLKEQKDYIIKAFCYDNVGHRSEEVVIYIDKIDRIEPYVSKLGFYVDLMQTKPYKLIVSCGDNDSGLDKILVEGLEVEFVNTEYNFYETSFDNLDMSTLKINIFDKAGNKKIVSILAHNFSNIYITEMVVDFYRMFHSLVENEYSESGWDKITYLYTNLNSLLMSEDATVSDFELVKQQINIAINGEITKKYTIESVPDFISTSLTFSFDVADIHNKRKSDSVVMVLNNINLSDMQFAEYALSANSLTGYEDYFLSPFELSFFHNDVIMEYTLENGVEINMPMPKGYEERYYAILNLDTNELINDIAFVNNKIIFTIKQGGRFALIVEGDKIIFEPQIKDGIVIFGKKISYLSFALSILSAIIFMILAVVLLTKQYKKPINK